jgi:hypothetical protein
MNTRPATTRKMLSIRLAQSGDAGSRIDMSFSGLLPLAAIFLLLAL